MTTDKIIDLAIIGAGPSALTAAIYTAREDIETVLFERSVVGGLAAITDMIDNYPGFPDGVSGFEIADRMQKQAERFGAKIEFGDVIGIECDKNFKTVIFEGRRVKAKSVLISTGSSFCKINVPGEAEYYGRGVHYCATCDGAFYKNKKAVVIGGGNSAVQEAIFLTRFACHIDIISLYDLTASDVLKKELKKYINNKTISVYTNTATKRIVAKDNRVVAIKAETDGVPVTISTDGVFIFIGLKPNTEFLRNSQIKLDKRGFIITDEKLETNIPGIFASGDVRSGATMQVASAVGEGATASISIREFLATIKG